MPILRLNQTGRGRLREGAALSDQADSVTIVILLFRRKPLAGVGGRVQRRDCGARVRGPSATAYCAHRPALVSDATAGLWWHRAGRDSAGSRVASPGSP